MLPIEYRYSEMSPSLIPMITAVIRLLAPSFLMELLRWNSTVFSDMVRISPISQFVFPSLHHRRHSSSCEVSRVIRWSHASRSRKRGFGPSRTQLRGFMRFFRPARLTLDRVFARALKGKK